MPANGLPRADATGALDAGVLGCVRPQASTPMVASTNERTTGAARAALHGARTRRSPSTAQRPGGLDETSRLDSAATSGCKVRDRPSAWLVFQLRRPRRRLVHSGSRASGCVSEEAALGPRQNGASSPLAPVNRLSCDARRTLRAASPEAVAQRSYTHALWVRVAAAARHFRCDLFLWGTDSLSSREKRLRPKGRSGADIANASCARTGELTSR